MNHLHAIFRVDASQEIGIGHLMRSFVLADMLKRRNYDILFISYSLGQTYERIIIDKGYKIFNIPDKQSGNSIEFCGKYDLRQTINALKKLNRIAEWLICGFLAAFVDPRQSTLRCLLFKTTKGKRGAGSIVWRVDFSWRQVSFITHWLSGYY